MKTKDIYSAIVLTLFFAIILCGIYPVVIWSLGQLLFPHQANGSLIKNNAGIIVGSKLIGQNFTVEKYFHPRPSAAGTSGYDATSSGGSNLGPTSKKLMDTIKVRVQAYRIENSLAASVLIPGDAVTASGSGLDPHISVKNALLQVPRVAKVRGISMDVVKVQIAKATALPFLGILGKDGVNVLKLNLALDKIAPESTRSHPTWYRLDSRAPIE